ncbi:MAG: hypothetical protein MUE60_00615 [Candidatus Eisenbacteria bacterium]|jgi:hypothetical protein|nr:hypothetical protein [Candidatus Eisenbacteria bacterium]
MSRGIRRAWLGVVVVGLLLTAGCKDFIIETGINPDGSGTRAITLEAGSLENDDTGLTLDQYRQLLGVTEQRGWHLVWEESPQDGERNAVFSRNARIPGIDSWSGASGDITLQGALAGSPFASVRGVNEVRATTARGAQSTTYEYRETFDWRGLREALVDFVAARLVEEVAREFPGITPEDRAELRGLAAGATAMDLPRLFDVSDEERASLPMVRTVGIYGTHVLSRRGIAAAPADLEAIAARVLDDPESRLEDFLSTNLPGVYAVALTNVSLSVTLPGTIVESNADAVEASTVKWEFGILDALRGPVTMHATSELRK